MRAMIMTKAGTPLELRNLPQRDPAPGEVLIRVHACGVCRTDLHVVDGELLQPKLPLVPGHEVIGSVAAVGNEVERFKAGDRIGAPWLGYTCGACDYCRRGRENLCESARFTGYQRDGGYAEFILADACFCFPITGAYSDAEAAPLMCVGLIGYCALRKTGDAARIGLYGFGAAAHIVIQVARYEGREVYGFARPGDDVQPPEQLEAVIIFAPVGELVPAALRVLRPGGRVVCAGIHMSDIPVFPYEILWREREIVSVANLTRRDAEEFLPLASKVAIRTTIERYPLAAANLALDNLCRGRVRGAAVLLPMLEP